MLWHMKKKNTYIRLIKKFYRAYMDTTFGCGIFAEYYARDKRSKEAKDKNAQ